jgi:hypothetical protein
MPRMKPMVHNQHKYGKEYFALSRIIQVMLDQAEQTGRLVERYYPGKPPQLTRGQVKKLQESNCRLYMQDSFGWYYLELDEEGNIVKRRRPQPTGR